MSGKVPVLTVTAVALLLSGCRLTFIEDPRDPSPVGSQPAPSTPASSAPGALVVGSGNVISERRNVRDFDSVTMSGSGTLLLQQSGSESLVIEAEDNILPLLTSEVKDRRLVLGLKPGSSYRASKKVVYHLTMKDLHGIGVSGSGDVQATGVSTDQLSLDGNGSFDMTLAGRAERLEVQISGSGEYQGQALESREAIVSISGSGDATVRVSDRLDASVSGSGNILYLGDPNLTQRVSGSGSIRRLSG
jgi:hypothetical protein